MTVIVIDPFLARGVPRVVTRRQARQALLNAGLLATVNALIAGIPGVEGERARIDWNDSQEVHRDWPLVASLGPALGLDDAALDALFIEASKL